MKRVLLLSIMTMLFVACSTKEEDNPSKEESGLPSLEEVIIYHNNHLGFSLLEKAPPNELDNTIISPFSLYTMLAMLFNGAEAETTEEINTLLGTKASEKEALNQKMQQFHEEIMQGDKQVDVKLAQSVWLHEHYRFQDTFSELIATYYDAEASSFNPVSDNTEEQMNKWVKQATEGNIDKIITGPIDSHLVAVLLQAIYFHGDWTYPFDKDLTKEVVFHRVDGDMDVQMMEREASLPYFETDTLQAVQLPYGDGDMHMSIFLPDDMERFSEQLSAEQWQSWQEAFEEKKGTIKLPKFELDYEAKLNEPLQQLGMVIPFTREQANFMQMIEADDVFWIDAMKQKTYLAVDETGTEAAGTTSAEITTTSLSIEEDIFQMEVNRPFMVVITDAETDIILFIGKIMNPVSE